MAQDRLDLLLVRRGLVPSREQAKRLIMAGEVFVGDRKVTHPGWKLPPDAEVIVRQPARFVGRGGFKLEGALEHFGVDVTNLTALDIGASTGGFTDCLLQRGATKVFAFDVGTNQLAWKLRSDPRVVCREKFNVRHMQPADVGQDVDLIVGDVSFISLTLVLPPAIQVLKRGGLGVVLVKPQFELSPGEVGKGGIVREPELHQKACDKIESFIRAHGGLEWIGITESSLQGTDGNREFLACFRRLA